MKAKIKWVEDMMFMGQSGSGHAVVVDGPPALGGKNMGIRPMEMMLMGLGGCTSFDVMLILQRSRQEVTDCVAELSSERAETDPKVFTKIHLHYVVKGKGLDEKKVARAVNMTAEKYCSVSIMLSQSVDVTHDFEVIEED